MSSLGPGGPRPSEPYPAVRGSYAPWRAPQEPRPVAPWGPTPPPTPSGTPWRAPRRAGATLVGVVAVLVLGLLALLAVGQIARVTGAGAAVVGAVVALVPLGIVLLGIRWVDRWEPEPRLALAFAFFWGAGVSTLAALTLNTAAATVIYVSTGDATTAEQVSAVVVAPVVEETAKGLGVLVLWWTRRRYFDGPVDGIVYAATVAAGFAFVENILYFGQSLDFLPAIFVMRGVMSPFAHVLFTSAIGIALGVAARRRSGAGWVWAFPLGWVVAVGLHALWNGTAVTGAFFAAYATVQVPLFVGVVLVVLWLRREERRVLATRLGEYAVAGWFARHEIDMLTSLAARRRARSWAARRGSRAAAAMESFQRAATELAFARQQAATGRAGVRHAEDERTLLQRVTAERQVFLTAAVLR